MIPPSGTGCGGRISPICPGCGAPVKDEGDYCSTFCQDRHSSGGLGATPEPEPMPDDDEPFLVDDDGPLVAEEEGHFVLDEEALELKDKPFGLHQEDA